MSETMLEAATALNLDAPVAEHWAGFSAVEILAEQRWWLAASFGDEEKLSRQCEKHLGAPLPQPGRFTGVKDEWRLLWAGERQWMIAGVGDCLPSIIENTGYVTEQSDGWVGFILSGHKTRQVMEKLCQLDLHETGFPSGFCARVAMEGMIAILACEDAVEPCYRLMFQRSSARSMMRHIRHAAFSTCGDKVGSPQA